MATGWRSFVPTRPDRLTANELLQIYGDLRRYHAASVASDAETVISVAHPRWIDAIGGPDAVRQEIAALGWSQHAARRCIPFRDVRFGSPTLIRRREHDFVIVPHVCEFNTPGQRIEAKGFDVAVRDKHGDWRYVGGELLTEAQLCSLFPDFPSQERLPSKSVRTFREEKSGQHIPGRAAPFPSAPPA
jgi:hypothetical protein